MVRKAVNMGVIGACIMALKYKLSSASIDEKETAIESKTKHT
jgi:hypothetical protein